MLTLVLVILVISILILAHEWGHFYSARKLGIKVEEFGFGFPPRIFSVVKNGIRYSFNLLPLGGFVKIYGEHGEGEGDEQSFVSRPAWQRFIVLFAGVGMNFVLAWIFFSAGVAMGIPELSEDESKSIPVSIIAVLPNSPAEMAGIKFGDVIVELRSQDVSLRVEREQDVRDFAESYRGEEITLVFKRADQIFEVKTTPRSHAPEGEGPLGIGLARLEVVRAPWYLVPIEGVKTLWRSIEATGQGLWMVATQLVQGNTNIPVSGPVGIFLFANDSRTLGTSFFLQFVGILSVNLAVLNFLPIPALDGGRILFLILEKIKGGKFNPALENTVHTVGFFVLIALMVLITYRDIARII